MSAADVLLARLKGVKARSADQWTASCPGPMHQRGDRSGGLGVKQSDDRVLINCMAGCSAAEIVAAVDLSLADLFERPLSVTGVAPVRQPPFPKAMAEKLFKAATVLLLAADHLRCGRVLSAADFETVVESWNYIEAIVTQAATWPKAVGS